MTKSIYEQFDAATRGISAYNISRGDEAVGRVVFTYARSGMRTTCWLQVWGSGMVKAYAGGCGYDKASAAFVQAAERLTYAGRDNAEEVDTFKSIEDNGCGWKDQLQALGLTVQHVID